jgi:hypothetical protein
MEISLNNGNIFTDILSFMRQLPRDWNILERKSKRPKFIDITIVILSGSEFGPIIL